jgi:Uma2 family endonuclease
MSILLDTSSTSGEGPRVRRWTLTEYQQAASLGLFDPEECLELIQGEIIENMPPNPLHSNAIDLIRVSLTHALLAVDCYLRSENPITMTGATQPQPDIAVVKGTPQRYIGRFPRPEEILLIVEIAESSLTYDRETKGSLYAGAGIRKYWILNLTDRCLEVHRDPQDSVWTTRFMVPSDGSIASLVAPDSLIAVSEILP